MSSVARFLPLLFLTSVPLACTGDAPGRILTPDAAAVIATGTSQDAPGAPAHGPFTDGPGVTVMSQNMYLGADVHLLLTATDEEDFLEVFHQLMISNADGFGRALQLAREIAAHEPHLVGLQEVTQWTFTTGEGTQVLDFLEVLQAYLGYWRAMGLTTHSYTAVRNDLAYTGEIALPGLPVIAYTDGDAVLIRDDVEVIDAPVMVTYDAYPEFTVAGITFDNFHGYVAVRAQVGGNTFWFGNTHLEIQQFSDVQTAQTAQLIGDFEDTDLPVVFVGDFNSAANHDAPEDQYSPTYRMLRNAGFQDLWLREPHSVAGYTCCQAYDLTNPVSQLTQRLDLILVRYGKAGFGGQSWMDIVGEEQADRITVDDPTLGPVTLWPSDHAGVVATFWPAPGSKK